MINKVHNMDCLDGLKMLDDNTIDLVVTSPPYDNLREYNGFKFEYKPVISELYRVLAWGGVVVWVVGDQVTNDNESGTSFKQALWFKEVGFNIHDTMIWRKSNPFNFGSNNAYIQSFEYMFVFSKGKIKTKNLIEDRENKNAGEWIMCQERDGDYMKYDKSKGTVVKKFGRRHNVWDIPTESGGGLHPAVFPEQLARDHIISWSNEGDLVADIFTGSGTTAKMAILNKRNYIGFEISEEYCKIAQKRIDIANEKMLQMSLF